MTHALTHLSPLPPAEYVSPTALILPTTLEYSDWEALGDTLRRCNSAAGWWWGDWLNFGEAAYNERYSQALEASDMAYQTLRNAAYVAGKIPPERRRPELSFSHHAEVASLEVEDQELLLNKAVEERLNRLEMRQFVKAYKDDIAKALGRKPKDGIGVPPAVQDNGDEFVPPPSLVEPDWREEYQREAQENLTLKERIGVLTATDEIAKQVERLHQKCAEALALVDQKEQEVRDLKYQLGERNKLVANVMQTLGVERWAEVLPAIEDLRR